MGKRLSVSLTNDRRTIRKLGDNHIIRINLDYTEPRKMPRPAYTGHNSKDNPSNHGLEMFFYIDDTGKPALNIFGSREFSINDKR